MNIQDRIIELLLAAFDRFMDWVTLGEWTRVCGEVIVIAKMKETGECELE